METQQRLSAYPADPPERYEQETRAHCVQLAVQAMSDQPDRILSFAEQLYSFVMNGPRQ